MKMENPSSFPKDQNFAQVLLSETADADKGTASATSNYNKDAAHLEFSKSNNAQHTDTDMGKELSIKSSIEFLFQKLHRKMQACQSFVTNLEDFSNTIPSIQFWSRTCSVDMLEQDCQEAQNIQDQLTKQQGGMTSFEHLAELNDALHKEVQTLEWAKFQMRRRIRECEALRNMQERNLSLLLETQQNMLKSVSESKIAYESDLKNLRTELDDRKAQWEMDQSHLNRMKIENEKLRKANSEQLQQIQKLEEEATIQEHKNHKKISKLTNKLEGVSADLLRSKRVHNEANEAYKELQQKYNFCIENMSSVEAGEKELLAVKVELQKLRESNKIEQFQAQLKKLETENFGMKNRLNQVEMTNNSSSILQIEKNRRLQLEVELSQCKEKYNLTVKALNKEAQTKIEDLHNRYNFFRMQMFAIYKVLQHNESYLGANKPEIYKAFIALKTALRNKVKAMECNKRSFDS